MIPFYDLKSVNQEYLATYQEALERVVLSSRYIIGPEVERFEEAFADYCGAPYCVCVGNGLDALTLTMRAYIELGAMEEGDEIIVPANTYIATILSISENRLTPVPVEPLIESYNLDPVAVEAAITDKTKGIMVVHLYGCPAEMESINRIAKKHNLKVIEDVAQAHGAKYKGEVAGSLSDAGCFSFFPGKNLGCLGDGGAVVTDDHQLWRAVRSLRNYGEILYENYAERKYANQYKGRNSRMDELQAAFLLPKLHNLDIDTDKRRKIAEYYQRSINNPLIVLPNSSEAMEHAWHLFVVRSPYRDRLKEHMNGQGVATLIHYPVPPHLQDAYKEWREYSFPITEQIHNEVLSIPLYPLLSLSDQEHIVNAVNSFVV
jgi:dTDP-4-amino-4,6-dideoxygalactose transaminase